MRSCNFSHDGRKFISCGFDRYIKMWDTETGECTGSYTNRKIPFCCKFAATESPHVFMAGCGDKKIIQWDSRKKPDENQVCT